jgi:ATP-dependent helicase/DNAse subunit B
MEFLNDIKEKTLLIIPSKLKEKVLLYIEEHAIFVPFKIIEFESLKNYLYFEYDDNAIYYLKKKFHIKKEVAKTYLKNLYYIDDSTSSNMLFLKQIKKELEENHLLFFNPYFLSSLSQYQVLFYGIDKYTKFDLNMIEIIKQHTNVSFIEEKEYPIEVAYTFLDRHEQIEYVLEEISHLLKKGINLSKIKIVNAKEEDYPYLKRMSKAYKIPIDLKENTLYATEYYQTIKKNILENKMDEMIENKYVDVLLKKINQVMNIDNLEEMMDEYAKEIYIDEKANKLELEELLNNSFQEDEYVFILNCNASILPKIYKDEDYLYDKIKPVFLENTYEAIEAEEQACIRAIKKIKNKTISFIKKEGGTDYFKSPILENVKIEEHPILYSTASHLENKKKYALSLDIYRKYGVYPSNMGLLKQNYTIPYLEYDHTFKPFKKNFLNQSFLLSYSSLNAFYECKFKYYLNYILKLKDFEENYMTYLGSLFHYILSCDNGKELDIPSLIKTYRENHPIELSKKEEFFLEENIKDLKEVLAFTQDFRKHTTFLKEENEKKFYVSILENPKITFMGVIDKKWQDEKGRIAVVDYKTGNTKLNLKDTYYGLSMQLPIYYYLLRKNYPNMQIAGFYLQNILEKNFKSEKNKTKKELKQASLKWNGYSIDDTEILEKLDSTYKDSRFIQSLKISKNGFYPYSKVLSQKQLDNLFTLTDNKIKKMVEEIRYAHFEINPKKQNRENISCRFCPYKSICFMNEKDIQELETITTLDFLGGKNNDELDERTNTSNL